MVILFHKDFRKKYKKLPYKVQKQVDERIYLFKNNLYDSQLNNHPLHGKLVGYWSINITGNYRALYKSVGSEVFEFVYIDTHTNLYE